MILKFDDIANLILREFVIVFKMDMEIITANVSTQRGIEKLITLPNIEKKRFSIFNMSKRLFFDIFTECVVKRKLSDELRKTIFEDNVLLMWISQTAITSLSFEMWVKARNLITLALIYHTPVMVHYLFMQDFNAIQILVSCISPEHFLKYLIFNVCPSIREKTSVSKPLASILSLQELDDIMVLQEVLILIYNALTEMRLVGDLKDPDSYFMERQVNHMVSCECKTKNVLKSKMYVDRSSFKSVIPDSRFIDIGTMMLHKACPQNPPQKDDAERAFIKYLNPGAPIYYLYTIPDTDYTFETLSRHYKDQVPYFLLPDVTDLREDFKGLNNFLFSETFFVFVMECFVRWYGKPELWKRDSLDLLLLILLILCLILRVSKYRDVCESDRERMFDFFGPHTKLENRSLLDIMMSERPNNQNPLVASMIDRFVSLSHLAKPSK
ncbi:hypothetical protein RF11_14153 [Thelohanellus kitauei]|uniref:Uncharacterized protein n=1 Tax=Thelohanellus kitauei TaxID=669202 RepID=A0A0C2M4M6_THEKT|nr:hypothetical protein RF11_14153 [Thelohanellus kitauei]